MHVHAWGKKEKKISKLSCSPSRLRPTAQILAYFNPDDSAVEAGRIRRQIQGPYPGNSPAAPCSGPVAHPAPAAAAAAAGSVEVVSCAGARSTQAGHDYGQCDGTVLLDQRDFLDGLPARGRLLDWVPGEEPPPGGETESPGGSTPPLEGGGRLGHWRLRLG